MPLLLLLAAISALAATPPSQLVPARWPSADPASLQVLANSPVNCLLIPEANWSGSFARSAHEKNITVLAILKPGPLAAPRARRAVDLGLDGVVLEGDFQPAESKSIRAELDQRSRLSIELGLRGRIPLNPDAPAIIGTFQGVWAGLNPHEEGAAHAAPSGAPWIDTNAGFLRFVRAASKSTFWLGAAPPANSIVNVSRYLQMISDTSMVGARWILNFEDDFFTRLIANEAKALKDFQRINQVLAFFEKHRALQELPAYGQLAVVGDVQSGALLSGSVLDMITVKHTPVRPIPFRSISLASFDQAKMAVNVDPQSLDETQKQILKAFTRSGGTVLTAPLDWRMPVPRVDQIVTDADDLKKLDQIWKEVNSMTGRRNLGARLFNASSMLSNMVGPPDGSKVVVFLVNYSDFPVDTIAVHLLGKYSKATIYSPERPPKALSSYDNEDGSGLDIDILETTAILIAEK